MNPIAKFFRLLRESASTDSEPPITIRIIDTVETQQLRQITVHLQEENEYLRRELHNAHEALKQSP